jgi:DNA-binding winged helix-turn-helix (wHTH) protein/tetratricopeptide (TPR) repeat protein
MLAPVQEGPLLSFPPFRLDLADERLWKDGKELRLRRKPFAILKYFVQNPRRLITHEEIVEAVWGKIAMSESLIRTHVRDLRQGLGEDIIETVVGRGYRLLADVQHVDDDATVAPAPRGGEPTAQALIGRGSELEVLEGALRSARGGTRSVVFASGDPGVGKTTLIDAFVESARAQGKLWVARGTCIEQFGSGEAYFPVLDALGGLCRGRQGDRVVEVLIRHAPTWLVQMPALVPTERLDELQRRAAGTGQPRMLREIAEALEAISNDAPVILTLDDLQWSDPSTLDLLAMLGRRRERARLLVIGTYRHSDLPPGHPLARIADELVAHRQARSLTLEAFDEETLGAYLTKRFPGHAFPPKLATTIHRMTGGNPLFVATLVEDLVSRGVIGETERGWALTIEVEGVAAHRPDSIRRLIDTRIDRLTATEQRILEAASVVGFTFTAGLVARVLGAPVDDVDSALESLAGDRGLLQYIGAEPWPDGAIHTRYAFVHALFQHAALERSAGASIRPWHRSIAEGLVAGYPGHEEEVAGEIAVHFERGQRPAQAARYYLTAGERALSRFGYTEALAHFERALDLVATLPGGEERDRFELRASFKLAVCQYHLRGAAAMPALERAGEVAQRLGDREVFADVAVRLLTCRVASGNFREAEKQARAAARALEVTKDARLRERATQFEGVSAFHRARFDDARRHFEALGVFDPGSGEPPTRLFAAYSFASLLHLFTGRPDAAVALLRRVAEAAEASGDPFERAALLCDGARLYAWRREPEKADDLASRALALADEGSFAMWKDRAKTLALWARAHLRPTPPASESAEWMSHSWDAGDVGKTLHTALMVSMCIRLGHEDQALAVISDTLRRIEETDERFVLPELHRLRGEAIKANDKAEAERAFKLAIEIAHEQSSLLLELRATLSLYSLSPAPKRKRIREELARLLSQFQEGHDTPDLLEAKAALAG